MTLRSSFLNVKTRLFLIWVGTSCGRAHFVFIYLISSLLDPGYVLHKETKFQKVFQWLISAFNNLCISVVFWYMSLAFTANRTLKWNKEELNFYYVKLHLNQISGKWCYITENILINLKHISLLGYQSFHWVKSVRIWSFYGLYFPAFELNTERYFVSVRIQSECGKIRTRKTPITNTF